MKTPVFYTTIRPAIDQPVTVVHARAHALGYELMPFAGFSDSDIGFAGNRGPRFEQSRENLRRVIEIQDACRVVIDGESDWPHIHQTI